ncbi:MAG: SRPBCC family protein [Brevundimonas sp.]|uniref:SRPBCC family protein n=1 Tax=Brevundimonas sp. TaxID=1871086 RepID=UPI00391921FE
MTTSTLPAEAGHLVRIEGGWELRFERRLRHDIERVWAALTTPEGLACWLAEAKLELEPGGEMSLNFRQPDHEFMPDTPERRRQSNTVLEVVPPRLFRHTFGSNPDSVVTWRLTPDGDGTHLSLTHVIPESWRDARRNVLSGWHYHMEGLDDAALGRRRLWVWDEWFALRDAYGATLED